MALLPWSVWSGQNEWKWTETTGAGTFHDLCITNSFFRTKPQHKVSWRHPGSKDWHQLDLILVRRAAIKNVLHTCSYHSVDCDTDHSSVCCKIRMQPKKFHCTKTKGIPRTNASTRPHGAVRSDLWEGIWILVTWWLPQRSGKFCVILYRTALATFGKRSSKSHDWFEAKSAVMIHVIEANRAAFAEYKRIPSKRNLQILRIARSKDQQTARRCANEFWTELSENIQSAAITGNIRGMYDGIKKAPGPALNKTAPLRSSTGKLSRIEDISWRDGWNTTPTSTRERTLCHPQPLMLSNACQPWKN